MGQNWGGRKKKNTVAVYRRLSQTIVFAVGLCLKSQWLPVQLLYEQFVCVNFYSKSLNTSKSGALSSITMRVKPTWWMTRMQTACKCLPLRAHEVWQNAQRWQNVNKMRRNENDMKPWRGAETIAQNRRGEEFEKVIAVAKKKAFHNTVTKLQTNICWKIIQLQWFIVYTLFDIIIC